MDNLLNSLDGEAKKLVWGQRLFLHYSIKTFKKRFWQSFSSAGFKSEKTIWSKANKHER